jgi:hypothetical protein
MPEADTKRMIAVDRKTAEFYQTEPAQQHIQQ